MKLRIPPSNDVMRVTCGKCGERFDLTARNVRKARERGEDPICRDCRYPLPEPTEEERLELREFWLTDSGLSLDEVFAIGWMIWPDLRGRRSRFPAKAA